MAEKNLVPEVRKNVVEETNEIPKGMVEFAIMDGEKEVSLHVTSQRTFDKSYASNPKYKIKKKGVK